MPVERRLSSPPLFDSRVVTDPGLSAIGATSALFTGENRFVATGPEHATATLYFVDVVRGSVATVTAETLGVSDIGGVTLVRVGDGQVVAWHGESSHIVTMSLTGTGVERIPLGLPAGFMKAPWELAALGIADGIAVLRQRAIGGGFGNLDGASYRQRVEFSLLRPGGDPEHVVQARGAERVWLAVREDSARGNVEANVVFGETVFSAPLGSDKVIVAETEADSIWVLDTKGDYRPLLPTPSRSVVVTEDDVRIERSRLRRRHAVDREMDGLMDMVSGRHREQLMALDRASRMAIDLAPVNRTPPAIADLVVDGQSRVWLKRFVPPTDSVATWEVWNTERRVVEFRLDAPREWHVLDARGDQVLLRAEGNWEAGEDHGLGRLLVMEMQPASRHDG